MTKIDTAYVQRNHGSDIEAFNMLDLETAKNHAANLMAYHNEEFFVVIRNEHRRPAERKSYATTSEGKRLKNMIKVYHQCTLTGSLINA